MANIFAENRKKARFAAREKLEKAEMKKHLNVKKKTAKAGK